MWTRSCCHWATHIVTSYPLGFLTFYVLITSCSKNFHYVLYFSRSHAAVTLFSRSHAAVTLFSRSLIMLSLYFPTLSCCCHFIFPLSHAAVTLFSYSLMLLSLDKRNKESLVSTFFFSGIWTGYNQERKRERATEGETERERDRGGDRESERERECRREQPSWEKIYGKFNFRNYNAVWEKIDQLHKIQIKLLHLQFFHFYL